MIKNNNKRDFMKLKDAFLQYVNEKSLNVTVQRMNIIDHLAEMKESHYSLEDVFHSIYQKDKSISQSTVYRTLKLLCEAGLIKENHFKDGITRYEIVKNTHHHDHLICTSCGKTIEVFNSELERLQEEIAHKQGFILTEHSHSLYGLCHDCKNKS